MPDISAIQNTPDVSFIDNKTIDDVRGDMVADFEAFMLQATGSKVSLGRASVHRMILYSAAAQIYQAMQYVLAECTATGNAGNGLAPGEVSTIVDPVPYITSAVNQNTTEGGADVENDESLAERVYLAPGAYSTAGPEDGYLYHAKKYNAAIGGGYCFHHGRRFKAGRGHDLRPAGVPLRQDDPPHDGQANRESPGGGHIQH